MKMAFLYSPEYLHLSSFTRSTQRLLHSLKLPTSPTMSPGRAPQEPNPFTKRITEIRDTVTKSRRVRCTAARLKHCITRSGLCRTHCVLGAVLGVVIGLVYYGLPTTRSGIEKRESLFRIVVGRGD